MSVCNINSYYFENCEIKDVQFPVQIHAKFMISKSIDLILSKMTTKE